MLIHELLRDKGILLIRPEGPIQPGDFESVARLVDPYIEQTGELRGVMIEAASFPGWGQLLPRWFRTCASFATTTGLSPKLRRCRTAPSCRLHLTSLNISSKLSFDTFTHMSAPPLLPGWKREVNSLKEFRHRFSLTKDLPSTIQAFIPVSQ